MLVHRTDDLFIGVRSRDLENARVALEDAFGSRSQTTCDDYTAVLLQRFADGIERFVYSGVDEATGVDDDDVGRVIARRDLVTFGAKVSQDGLGIHERLA